MSFQIKNLYLYQKNGDIRDLAFKQNAVNIITGASKTGKSAIIQIVDYCLGAHSSHVPAGVIPKTVEWYGLLLTKGTEQLFVARKAPDKGRLSSEEIYIEKKRKISRPLLTGLQKNANLDTLISVLNSFCGIKEYSFEPRPGQTRQTGVAEIGKALIYCFQEQSEVANKNLLFHRQSEQFLPQSIKDYMPFFLGAVDGEFLKKQEDLRQLKSQLRAKQDASNRSSRVLLSTFAPAHALISEAISVGLLGDDTEHPDSMREIAELLKQATLTDISDEPPNPSDANRLEVLFREHEEVREQYRRTGEEISFLTAMQTSGQAFSTEGREQFSRLSSINLIPESTHDKATLCPVCSSNVSKKLPPLAQLQKRLRDLDKQLQGISADFPHIEKLKRDAEEAREQLQSRLNDINHQIQEVRKSNERLREFRDTQARRALVKGRITYYLQTIGDHESEPAMDSQISQLESQVQQLQSELTTETIEQRLESIVSRISFEITGFAKKLGLEHANFPFRFDPRKLTVFVDTDDESIPLSGMGSAENWVFVHLITHIVLHRWFSKKKLPVPRFLFLDQPTQAFFPPQTADSKVRNTDNVAVASMFKFMQSMVRRQNFQIIVTDHADLPTPWFQRMILEKWWDGKQKLIPHS